MVDFLKNKKSILELWTDRCNIFKFQNIVDEYGISRSEKIEMYNDVPCRISFKNISSTTQTEIYGEQRQMIKLFVSSELEVPENSIIEVIRDNRQFKYKNSGTPAVYTNHQEIILENYIERS